jgi:capsid portal protein
MDERVQKIISDLAEAKRFKDKPRYLFKGEEDSPASLVKTAVIEIKMENAAFGERHQILELSRILTRLSDDVERHLVGQAGDFTTIVDINGNTVGSLKIVEK